MRERRGRGARKDNFSVTCIRYRKYIYILQNVGIIINKNCTLKLQPCIGYVLQKINSLTHASTKLLNTHVRGPWTHFSPPHLVSIFFKFYTQPILCSECRQKLTFYSLLKLCFQNHRNAAKTSQGSFIGPSVTVVQIWINNSFKYVWNWNDD